MKGKVEIREIEPESGNARYLMTAENVYGSIGTWILGRDALEELFNESGRVLQEPVNQEPKQG